MLDLAFLLLSASDVRVATTAELVTALKAARDGAQILVAPGDYEGFHVADVGGRESWVTLLAADPSRPPVFRGQVQLSDVHWLALRDLEITGSRTNGLNIDDGGTFDTPAHHVTLTRVRVHDIGAGGNEDGIKLSGIDGFRLIECTVERWGRGGSAVDMVGCRDGRIERCTIRGDGREPGSTGVQAKGGTRDVEIVDSRFEHAGDRAVNVGGSTALAYFRPRPEGFEARDIRVVDCTFVGSEAPIAFVGVDGATVERCTFYRPRKWFFRVLQETRDEGFVPCRKGVFRRNLVVYRRDEISTPINVGPHTAPETFEIAENYWWSLDDSARSVPELPLPQRDAQGGRDPMLRDPERGDFTRSNDSPARGYGNEAASGSTTIR